MKKGGVGGGNTKTGAVYETKTDLKTFLNTLNGYHVDDDYQVFYKKALIGSIFKKNAFYVFLQNKGVDWKDIVSKRLMPDDSIYVLLNNVFYVIECKFQGVGGSVDEKLQTCDFKKKQYKKLLSKLNIEVEYIYILSDWFKKPCYKDSLDYIQSVGCDYYFDYIPLMRLGLPVPEGQSDDFYPLR
jgi:hypothetical protein